MLMPPVPVYTLRRDPERHASHCCKGHMDIPHLHFSFKQLAQFLKVGFFFCSEDIKHLP